MKRFANFMTALCMGFIGCASACGADLPHTDPDRAAILQAARPAPEVKFVVKDLRKFGDFAFLCALEQIPGGGIVGTDDQLDVHMWTFVRDAGRWLAIDVGGGFAKDAQHVACDIGRIDLEAHFDKIESEQDIVRLTVAVVKDQIQSNLDYRQLADTDTPVLRALKSKKVVGDIPIEHVKKPIEADLLAIAKERCASRGCVQETESAFRLLGKARTENTTSSLVWAGCQYGRRALSVVAIQRCVSNASRLPYCRPQMKLDADRKEIGHCIADMRAMCEKDLPGLCN